MSGGSHLMAVDGGGSGCRAALAAPDGRVLGTGRSGPANATSDMAQTVANVLAAIGEAVRDAGLDDQTARTAVTVIGLAGVLTEEDGRRVSERLGLGNAYVTGDRQTALAGALGGRNGVLLSIGTGTIAGASRHGLQRFVCGWGFQVSDQASGAWLGRALLEKALLAHDRIEPETALTRKVLDRFGGDPLGIVDFVQTAGPAEYATLAPDVIAEAKAGDAAGLDLMRRGVDYLQGAVAALGIGDDDVLCLGGGIGPAYADYLPKPLRARIAPLEGTALDGALRLARSRAEGGGPE